MQVSSEMFETGVRQDMYRVTPFPLHLLMPREVGPLLAYAVIPM